MKKLLLVLALPALAGCLSSSPLAVTSWTVDYAGSKTSADGAKYGVARLLQVAVRSPYAGSPVAVLRADGSIAFDAYNTFAAPPAQLVKGLAYDAANASGLFSSVVGATSSAAARVAIEAEVVKLALDCREEGARRAVARVQVRLIDGRDIVATVVGEGAEDASGGNYGAAFSTALSAAFASAFGLLK